MADIEIVRGETKAWHIHLYQEDGSTPLAPITGYQRIWAALAESKSSTPVLERDTDEAEAPDNLITVVSEGVADTTPPEIKLTITSAESLALPVGELLLGLWWRDANSQDIAIRPWLTVLVHEGVGELSG